MSQSELPAALELLPETRLALVTLADALSPRDTLLIARWLLERINTSELSSEPQVPTSGEDPTTSSGLTILYGSHSGHSASIAKLLANQVRGKGWPVAVADMADYPRGNLKRETTLVLISSTHGEGQPPESATPFFEYLLSSRAPQLTHCSFAVLALGDRTYPQYCQAGIDLETRLAALGASALLERVDLDLDYQEGAEAWIERVLETLAPRMHVAASPQQAATPRSRSRIDRDNPWSAELLDRVLLSGRGSTQCYAHLELSLEGSGLRYEPGDALGVRPENDPELVEHLITALGAKDDAVVSLAGESSALGDALRRRLEISLVLPSALRKYARLGTTGLEEPLRTPEATQAYLRGRDWLDILQQYPLGATAQDFVAILPELASRSYSIASSQSVHPDEVHLLVSRLAYESHGRRHAGTASSYLTDRLPVGGHLPVWIEHNPHFRLPADPTVPIILIGAGTGIAPYRAFLEARAAAGATGKNWVFFGNRHFRSDFTYQTEWLRLRERGLLSRMDVAFSRDGTSTRYVTDALRAAGRDLFDWLEQGAQLYLCGDRAKLSGSTDQALIEVVSTHGGRTLDEASTYLAQLSSNNRYLKDVY